MVFLSLPEKPGCVRQGTGDSGGEEELGSPRTSHLKLEASSPSLQFHLERSFLSDKIKAFPLPNHYLIFEAIIELIVSISLVSSCSRLSLSVVVRLQKKGSARPRQPGQRGEGGEQGRGPGSCPAAFSRDRADRGHPGCP